MQTSIAGVRLIENFEGYSGTAYQDSVGVWTIGYGTTSADVSPLPSSCTRAQAEGWLQQNLARKYEPSVNALGAPLNQNQFDALVSLAYNCGPGSMSWQIGRDVQAKNWSAAANDFMHYVYAGGNVLQGLVNRRAAEKRLFETPTGPPPPPPDPHHYLWYPNEPFNFKHKDGRHFTINEERTVVWYDELIQHPWRNSQEIHMVRARIRILRDRVKSVARMSNPPHWNDGRHLSWRWHRLDERLHGKSSV